jgi:hypothetical protein
MDFKGLSLINNSDPSSKYTANRFLIPTSMPVSLLPIGFKGILKAIIPDHLLLNLV